MSSKKAKRVADPNAEVLTVDDLAARWDKPVWSVRKLVRERKVPCLRLGRQIRFRRADILAWEAKEVAAG